MASSSRTPVGMSKPTVLVIEDNSAQWFIIRWAIMQRFSEVEPIWFSDPAKAILYLEDCLENSVDLPQLILLDLCSPACQVGLHTLKLLKKADKLYQEIPVVVLSQCGDAESIRAAYEGGANSYMAKPLTYVKWLEWFALFRSYWWNGVELPDLKQWGLEAHKSRVDRSDLA